MIQKMFKHRYTIILVLVCFITVFGFILNYGLNMPPDKVAPILTGSFVVIALFLNALSYEYNADKNRIDSQKQKDSLTYNAAVEWHKPPIIGYVKTIVKHDPAMKSFIDNKDGEKLFKYLTDNLDVREAVGGVLNYFETITLGVEQGLIDAIFIRKFFESIFISYYDEYDFYITYRREFVDKSDTVWLNFTTFASKWKQDKEKKSASYDANKIVKEDITNENN